jgi:hypothetical protein
MAPSINELVNLFDGISDLEKKDIETDLLLIEQITQASSGEIDGETSKASRNDKMRAAIALARVADQLLKTFI